MDKLTPSSPAPVPGAIGRRASSGLGLAASIALHGGVLAACLSGLSGERGEVPSAIDVAVVFQSAPEAPPAPSAKAPLPAAAPAPIRTKIAPPRRPSPLAEPAESSAGRSAAETAGTAGSVGQEGDIAMGTPDRQAGPSPGNPAPAYPLSARRAGREGRAVLLVVVGAGGECREIRIEESSGTPSLDEAAAAAVRLWRFIPAQSAGKAVEAAIRVPIAFKLTNAL